MDRGSLDGYSPWGRGPGEPGRLQSVGSQRVGHDLATEKLPFLCV